MAKKKAKQGSAAGTKGQGKGQNGKKGNQKSLQAQRVDAARAGAKISPAPEGPAPAISVLVPICNAERYLEQALDSLLAQAFADFEVLCINDGSSDGSLGIIQRYMANDQRFRLIDKDNSGYGASMNLGIDTARGEYVGILEPDDFFEPNALELLHGLAKGEGAAGQEQADVAKANYWFYWSQPKERNQLIEVCKPPMTDVPFNPRDQREVFFCIPSIWSALYRREFLNQRGIRFLETAGASYQDLGFQFKVWVKAQRVAMSQQPILHYRQDNEASSVNDPSKALCVRKEFDSAKRFIKEDPQREMLEKVLFRLRYDSYMWNFARLTVDKRKEFVDYMREDLREGLKSGAYDSSLFGSWQDANLRYMLSHPKRFEQFFPKKPTALRKAWYYLVVAGPKGVLDAMRH